MWHYLRHSTLKREASSILMLWVMILITYVILTASEAGKLQLVETLIYPVGLIFAGAFGMDWISKQTNIAGPAAGKEDDKG